MKIITNEYEEIAEFFYSKASVRIKTKVIESKRKHRDILSSDPKLISRIINNNRQRNNPYLINDFALETSYEDIKTGKRIPDGIVPKLGFSSRNEVLWGTDLEIQGYIHELFLLLWDVVCEKNNLVDYELYLYDYVPFAKFNTYWRILSDSNIIDENLRFHFERICAPRNDNCEIMLNFPATFLGINEDYLIENLEKSKIDAIEYLYNKCKDSFLSQFIEFCKTTDSFHKLNKSIDNKLVSEIFLNLIKAHEPNVASLGIRVKNLIYEDLSYSASIICERDLVDIEYRKQLITASSNYILELEKIQRMNNKKE